jgi:hypothetical protein
MNAGRELDALVADKVMGKPWSGAMAWCAGATEGFPVGLDSYSSDMSAAWRVVENIRARGFCIYISASKLNVAPDGWKVYFEGRLNWPCVVGESLTLAICLAALKAVGVAVEEK